MGTGTPDGDEPPNRRTYEFTRTHEPTRTTKTRRHEEYEIRNRMTRRARRHDGDGNPRWGRTPEPTNLRIYTNPRTYTNHEDTNHEDTKTRRIRDTKQDDATSATTRWGREPPMGTNPRTDEPTNLHEPTNPTNYPNYPNSEQDHDQTTHAGRCGFVPCASAGSARA